MSSGALFCSGTHKSIDTQIYPKDQWHALLLDIIKEKSEN